MRTFTESTPLDDLNYGQGVGITPDPSTDGATNMTVVKFTIKRADGAQLNIDLTNPQTVGNMLNAINNDPANADGKLVARFSTSGNGIELVDTSTGSGSLTVIPDSSNTLAVNLGLVAATHQRQSRQLLPTAPGWFRPIRRPSQPVPQQRNYRHLREMPAVRA